MKNSHRIFRLLLAALIVVIALIEIFILQEYIVGFIGFAFAIYLFVAPFKPRKRSTESEVEAVISESDEFLEETEQRR